MAALIHCITNPISMMQCANAILSLGAKPIMAEHPAEVNEITKTASALLINTGNISDSRMEAMRVSLETALEKKIPVVIDAVGAACSRLRRDFILELLGIYKHNPGSLLLVKGNYSEIKALLDETYRWKGVDAADDLYIDEIAYLAGKLSIELGALVLASGEKDIVTDGDKTFFISNGNKQMGQITGTGCMLGAICATFLGKEEKEKLTEKATGIVADACSFFGIAGEIAERSLGGNGQKTGCGSFLISLLDALSVVDDKMQEKMKMVDVSKTCVYR
ncbi:hydroxyethylthiazole kinase [Butyrivibrio sp. AE3004]|uniref:hydroxyethylthiazole kinase n=1 Tax=Butyrivibrio sp. AE3004 TaxID=1506994 RepID=UPI0004944614|nr:hydroxyethylthiazole kinase [Butyrivibrio sp. AE3004]